MSFLDNLGNIFSSNSGSSVSTPTITPTPTLINQEGDINGMHYVFKQLPDTPKSQYNSQSLPSPTPSASQYQGNKNQIGNTALAGYTRSQIPSDLGGTIIDAARQYGIHPALLAAVLFQESGISPNAKDIPNYNKKGKIISYDRGIAQINNVAHPEVSRQQAKDPNFAIPFAAKLLSDYIKQVGSVKHGVAAYNVGPGMVGIDSSRPTGLGPRGQKYLTGVKANLDPSLLTSLGLE